MKTFYLQVSPVECVEIYANSLAHARISARCAGYSQTTGYTTVRPDLDKIEICLVLNAPNN